MAEYYRDEPHSDERREWWRDPYIRQAIDRISIAVAILAAFWMCVPIADVWLRQMQQTAAATAEKDRIDLERYRIEKTSANVVSQSEQVMPLGHAREKISIDILDGFVDAQRVLAGQQKSDHSLLQPILALVDTLAATGTIVAKDADKLRAELQKAAIDGGKEIVVDVAKELIHKYIGDHKANEHHAIGENAMSPGAQNVQINTVNCSAPPPKPTVPSRCPIKRPKKKTCTLSSPSA